MYRYKVWVTRVVDGDTVDVDIDLGFGMTYKKQRVRMVGIDTPESRTRDLEEKIYWNIIVMIFNWSRMIKVSLAEYLENYLLVIIK